MFSMLPQQVRQLTQQLIHLLLDALLGLALNIADSIRIMKKIPRSRDPNAMVPGWYLHALVIDVRTGR